MPKKFAGEATAPHAPDLRWERVWPPYSTPNLDPSFQNTFPHSETPQHDTLFILDTLSPLDSLFYYFCSIKASPRPDDTACRLVFPPQYAFKKESKN